MTHLNKIVEKIGTPWPIITMGVVGGAVLGGLLVYDIIQGPSATAQNIRLPPTQVCEKTAPMRSNSSYQNGNRYYQMRNCSGGNDNPSDPHAITPR